MSRDHKAALTLDSEGGEVGHSGILVGSNPPAPGSLQVARKRGGIMRDKASNKPAVETNLFRAKAS